MSREDERLNWGEELWEGATLVASSRSGVTENIRLSEGTLVGVYHFKSGRVACQTISQIDRGLTIRLDEPY